MRVFKSRWFDRFARKERIEDATLWEAIARAEKEQIDADLGGGMIKQRIARLGRGRSTGYRAIVFFRHGSAAERKQFKEVARHVLALSESAASRVAGETRLCGGQRR